MSGLTELQAHPKLSDTLIMFAVSHRLLHFAFALPIPSALLHALLLLFTANKFFFFFFFFCRPLPADQSSREDASTRRTAHISLAGSGTTFAASLQPTTSRLCITPAAPA